MAAEDKVGAEAQFEFDRMTVERFRETFPRARWDEVTGAWWVPGKTAERRIARWQALEQTKTDLYADAKGEDAFTFDPIVSVYLESGAELVVRTPYSRTIVEELRQVPYARWDDVRRAWVVPYRSYEDLRKRWAAIEEAARRNEPEQRKARREAAKGTEADKASRLRTAERRRHRYPVPVDDPPPLGRPVATSTWGIVVFSGSTGELVDIGGLNRLYGDLKVDRELVWATWRTPSLSELLETWPARSGPSDAELSRGWWQPTKAELVSARRAAKSREGRHENG